MLAPLADLVAPRRLVTESMRATGELARIAIGRSDVAPAPTDRRFDDPAWTLNPVYRRWAQTYLTYSGVLDRLAEAPRHQGDWRRAERARFVAKLLADATAPTNTLAGNPAALKHAFDTGGVSLLRGARNATRDVVRNHGLPKQVDRRPYVVGENLAATPGAVVYRDDVFELVQYAPSSASVQTLPVLMIPPQVNKHYFLDLAPGRSMVEYLVARGLQYFTVVWRNPTQADGGRSIDDYVAAQLRAVDVVLEITGAESLNLIGVCAGGLTTGLMLGHLAATGQAEQVTSATFAISMIDTRHPNPMGMLATGDVLRDVARDADARAVYDRRRIGRAFAWLRPDDLVFNYVVNDWLMGKDAPAFDILAWNDDGSDLPSRFFSELLDLYVHNHAAQPGRVDVLDVPVDLRSVTCDSFVVSGMRDHITPWDCGYETARLLGGRSEVVVTTTGHIQTMVNPPGKPRARYFAGPEPGPEPQQWLDAATEHEGSWWPRYADWLLHRSGEGRAAPGRLGSRRHRVLDPAPGRYVHG
ncbi:polyhydroxyalkanoate synthase [Solirubrobacter pauli]|uniref:Polyhydroxyalkanoate synthase n=1 Tax=Solirubrobacter pauli TaxID=166793 RepID=A0A660L0V9_9ACTN|nr:alpha/beta fold hydrolase [Solirubrobacter pauli]RKQ86854.1 polyhydroxyalkanoate synthase [Solirubrobacter pauli]